MNYLPMYLALFPVNGPIKVSCVFIWVNINGIFLRGFLISIKIDLRSLKRTFLEAIEG